MPIEAKPATDGIARIVGSSSHPSPGSPMSDVNPYHPTQSVSENDFQVRKVKLRPFELMSRSFQLIRNRYWLFLGLTVVGILVGSAVPFGMIMGAMMAGMYLCYIHQEQELPVEFATLFKGFDYFVETLKAWLVLLGASMVVLLPFMAAMFVLVMMPILEAAQASAAANQPMPPPPFPKIIFVLYPIMLIANIAITLPFLFVFQLIVDRGLTAMQAIRMSFHGVRKDALGVIWLIFVLTAVSMVLTMMCYIPGILFLPISLGAAFIAYRDIYGPGIQRDDPRQPAQPMPPPVGMPQ